LEYIDGRDLKEFLAENPSTQLRERVLQQLLSAVSYLHTKGIIHNDIKPENILISRTDNSVKLIDFGLSDSDAHYVYKTLGCSPQYASPELLRQEKLDARSDIYSLGLIIRSLLGGKATRIANKCCAINKKDRYANVEQLTKALSQRRLPLWMVLGSVLGIALILGGTLLLREMNELRLYKSEKEQMQARCDSVYLATEARVQALFAELDANSQDIPYREFVNAELKKLQQGIVDLRESWSKVTDDPVLISSFEHHLWQEHNKHISIFLARAAALPEFTYSKLPREEKQFYLSLLSAGEPYRPYHK
jgi:serine/threonine protein kinase